LAGLLVNFEILEGSKRRLVFLMLLIRPFQLLNLSTF